MEKIKMINLMSIIILLILIPLGIVDLIRGHYTAGGFVLVIAVVLIFNQISPRKSANYLFPICCSISIVAFCFLYTLVTGGVGKIGFLWYFTFPLFTLLLLGSKRGVVASLLLLSLSIIFFAAKVNEGATLYFTLPRRKEKEDGE